MFRFELRNRSLSSSLIIAAIATYVLVFFLLYPIGRESSAALVILPVAVIAGLGGQRLGVLSGLLSFPFNTLLLNLVEQRLNPWTVLIESGGGPGSIAIVLIGLIIGFLHDRRVQLSQELMQRHKVESALHEREQQYQTLLDFAERRTREGILLDQVRQALARELELPLIFRTIIEGIAQTLGYTQVSIYLIDDNVLVLQQQVGYDRVIERIPVTDGVSGRVVRSRQPLLVEDVHTEPAFLGAIEGITSEVCVPLFDQGKVVGILNVESIQGVRLTEADLHLMSALGEQISIALERARLYSEVRESEQRFRQLTEHIEQVFWLEDLKQRRIIYVSPAYESVWGRSMQSLYQYPQSWFDSIYLEDRARVFVAESEKGSGRYNIEYRLVRPDGSIRWVWSRAFPIQDPRGQVYRIAGITEDITERKAAEATLMQNEERFKLMAWATKDAVWDWDLQTHQIWWGEGLQKIFHYSSEITQTDSEWWFEHIHPEDRSKVRTIIAQSLENNMEFWSKEYRFQKKDGSFADMMGRGYILRDGTGVAYRMIGAMLDITERKYMESMLLKTNEQMGQFLNELQRRNVEIALLNEMSRMLQACQSPEEAYRIISDFSSQLFPVTSGALYLLNASRTVASAVTVWGELPAGEQKFAPNECWTLRQGQTRPLTDDPAKQACLHLVEPLPATYFCIPVHVQGETLGILHIRSQDEEHLHESKRQLAYTIAEQSGMALSNINLRSALREQSIRDPLTGLYNRRYMEEALRQQLSRVTRHLHTLGIIMIDIDHFKDFNDDYGHAIGDMLLRDLGQFLQRHVRGEDIACRYGGEEFIIIVPDVSLETTTIRAEQLCRNARELSIAISHQQHVGVTLSLGVAIYPLHGRNIETVLRTADDALYRAKREGRDRVVVADEV